MALVANEQQDVNAAADSMEIFLQPGEFYFGSAPTLISTMLHSRSVITVWHPKTRIGGMCHVEQIASAGRECEMHYGDCAIAELEKLANKYHTPTGEYEVRVYMGMGVQVQGKENTAAEEIKLLLKKHRFNVTELDSKATSSRKIKFDLSTGKIEKRDIGKAAVEKKNKVVSSQQGNDDFALEIFLHPGDLYFGRAPTIISTLLGSCVAAMLWHPQEKIGGMCHVILPESPDGKCEMRYGNCAIQEFAKQAEKFRTRPGDYEVHIYGGSDMFPGMLKSEGMKIGDRNIEKVKELLKHYKFHIKDIDTGGTNSRKVRLDLSDGSVGIRKTSKPVEG